MYKKNIIYYMNSNSNDLRIKNKKFKPKQRTSIKRNIKKGLEDYYNNENQNLNIDLNELQNELQMQKNSDIRVKNIKSNRNIADILNYILGYKKDEMEYNQYTREIAESYIENILMNKEDILYILRRGKVSNLILDDKIKIIENLKIILIPKIQKLDFEIQTKMVEKISSEEILERISDISNNIHLPVTMNQFIPKKFTVEKSKFSKPPPPRNPWLNKS